MESAEQLICRVIRAPVQDWPGSAGHAEVSRFIASLDFHGMATLVGRALSGDAGASWPAAIRDYCRGQTLAQAVAEMAVRMELARVLRELADSGIKALVLKGTSLAYSHYSNPVLRPRGDVDLLIPQSGKRQSEQILRRLGYVRALESAGDYVSYQASWSLKDGLGVIHDLDLHWRVNNSQVLAKLLDYDELAARATTVPELCANAHAPAPIHALLFACMHLAGHRTAPLYMDGIAHPAGERLIWLYDIHLLVSAMPRLELEEFVALAIRKRMASICRDALVRSAECFHTRLPEPVVRQLSPAGATEPSARYCNAGRARRMVDDVLALGSAGARARLLGEWFFPSAAYMRDKYADAAVSWLPFLYARRAVQALWKISAPRISARD